MAWSDLTFTGCTVLTAAQMTQLQANFAALAHGDAGAPAFSPSSFMWTRQASGASLDVSSRGTFRQAVISDVASVNTLNVAGTLALTNLAVTGPGSFGSVNVGSEYQFRGAHVPQLLQRVHRYDATSRASVSATYSTYMVASLTPVCSGSALLVRAGIYIRMVDASTPGQLGSHLARNPMVVNSLAYLTNCSNVIGAPGNFVGDNLFQQTGLMPFERMDSASNVDPRQYGVNWARAAGIGTVSITGAFVTIEEWM
jgi:hypothetical protein